MSAEKIIKQIQNDAEQKIKKINNETEEQIKKIIDNAKSEGQEKAKEIKKQGEKECDKIKRNKFSKTNQEMKKKKLQMKEEIINKCFRQASEKLGDIHGEEYRRIVERLMQKAKQRFGEQCKILISRDEDKKIAEKMNLQVKDYTDADGGIVIQSVDGKVSIITHFVIF